MNRAEAPSLSVTTLTVDGGPSSRSSKPSEELDRLANLHRISGVYEPGKVDGLQVHVSLSNGYETAFVLDRMSRERWLALAQDIASQLPTESGVAS